MRQSQKVTSKIIIEKAPALKDRTKELWSVVERQCNQWGFLGGKEYARALSEPMDFKSARRKFDRLTNG